MKPYCARVIYYACFFIACFASLGTVASFLFGKSKKPVNNDANKQLKIICPVLLVASIVVMVIAKCNTKNTRNRTMQENGQAESNRTVIGHDNGVLQWHEFFLGSPPTYDETVNSLRSPLNEPPPKYEDIATQSWKPEDEGLTEYRLQHRSGTQGQIFTISLSARTSDSQPGLGMERPEGLAIEAEPEAWGRPERGTAPEGGTTPERALERGTCPDRGPLIPGGEPTLENCSTSESDRTALERSQVDN